MPANLKKCPCCNADPALRHDSILPYWWVECPGCGLHTRMFGGREPDGRQAAIKAWNRRSYADWDSLNDAIFEFFQTHDFGLNNDDQRPSQMAEKIVAFIKDKQ